MVSSSGEALQVKYSKWPGKGDIYCKIWFYHIIIHILQEYYCWAVQETGA